MKSEKYKALVCNGVYINPDMLYYGLYQASAPRLYDVSKTIDDLISSSRESMGDFIIGSINNYIANLRKCKFIEIELKYMQQ